MERRIYSAPHLHRGDQMSALRRSLEVFIGLVFLASGSSKLNASFEFLHTVAGYELLGWWATIAVAASLPWFELVIGAALVVGVMAEAATSLAVLLSICFVIACTSALHRNLAIPCGCFGSSDPISTAAVVRSWCMLGITLLAFAMSMLRQSDREQVSLA